MKVDLSFQTNYDVEIVEELGSGNRYYYPGATTQKGKDGLIIKVIPSENESWIGVFAFGEISIKGVSGIYTTPNPEKLCVVSRGMGYIVSTNNPIDWEEVVPIPIMEVYSVAAQNLLIFADYTKIYAYNASGLKWKTERLAFNSFKIIEVTDTSLKGRYWNERNDRDEIFEIDLLTGLQIGEINNI
jgi:hypothetical protein